MGEHVLSLDGITRASCRAHFASGKSMWDFSSRPHKESRWLAVPKLAVRLLQKFIVTKWTFPSSPQNWRSYWNPPFPCTASLSRMLLLCRWEKCQLHTSCRQPSPRPLTWKSFGASVAAVASTPCLIGFQSWQRVNHYQKAVLPTHKEQHIFVECKHGTTISNYEQDSPISLNN